MKPLLLILFAILSVRSHAQKSNEELAKEVLKRNIEGPLPALNAAWEVESLTMNSKTFYRKRIAEHVKDGFEEVKRAANKPVPASDSIRLCHTMDSILHSILDLSYTFTGNKHFRMEKNGKYETGTVALSNDRNSITLYLDGKDRSMDYKINQLNDATLVLAQTDDYGKEVARFVFKKRTSK